MLKQNADSIMVIILFFEIIKDIILRNCLSTILYVSKSERLDIKWKQILYLKLNSDTSTNKVHNKTIIFIFHQSIREFSAN